MGFPYLTVLAVGMALVVAFRRRLARALFDVLVARGKGQGAAFLAGNFAPVSREVHSVDLEVEGAVPAELDGWYARTGPNMQFPVPGGYHWFGGDAMIHSVRLADGAAKGYSNHWVRSFTHAVEKAAGKTLYVRFGDMRGRRGLLLMLLDSVAVWRKPGPAAGLFPAPPSPLEGTTIGNTSIVCHDNKVLAVSEGSLPFQLRLLCNGAIESLGALSYGGQLRHAFTAHPKIDYATGEMLTFGYRANAKPYVIFNVVSPKGELSADVPVDVLAPVMMHDFAITERYAVFMDANFVFDGKGMLKKDGFIFKFDRSRPGRIGLLQPADVSAPIRWFEVPPYFVFHTANAWEEGDTVHLAVCRYEDFDLDSANRNPWDRDHAILSRYSINTATGDVSLTTLVPATALEFPVIAPHLVGRKARFCWAAEFRGAEGNGCVKADLTAGEGEGRLGRIEYPEGCGGGEMVFVPRDADAAAAGTAAEDDGFLIGYITHLPTVTSYCVIYDAATMASEPLARIKMPQRVPYGFHGAFVRKDMKVSAA